MPAGVCSAWQKRLVKHLSAIHRPRRSVLRRRLLSPRATKRPVLETAVCCGPRLVGTRPLRPAGASCLAMVRRTSPTGVGGRRPRPVSHGWRPSSPRRPPSSCSRRWRAQPSAARSGRSLASHVVLRPLSCRPSRWWRAAVALRQAGARARCPTDARQRNATSKRADAAPSPFPLPSSSFPPSSPWPWPLARRAVLWALCAVRLVALSRP